MDRQEMDEKRAAIMAVLREAGHEMPEPRRRRKVRRVASGGNSRLPIPPADKYLPKPDDIDSEVTRGALQT